jgi:hypothetical protein
MDEPLLLCLACGESVAARVLRCAACGIPFRGPERGVVVRLDLRLEIVGSRVRLTIEPVELDEVS